MRCLICGRKRDEGSLRDILLSDDPLCSKCRKVWMRKRIHFRIKGIPAEAFYVYNSAFSSALIQYKECGDEALRDIFLYEVRNELRRKYHGYTFLRMPSTETKRNQRGFDHLEEMLKITGIRSEAPFYKIHDFTQKQSGKTERARMETDIGVREGYRFAEKIVLFDDVITTGSTIRGALACIPVHSVKVRIAACAANAKLIKLPFQRRKDIIE